MSETLKNKDASSQVKATPKLAWFEPVALILLSLATVGTAWCSYEAAAWGAVAAGLSGKSAMFSRTAAANELQAQQVAVLDVLLFSQYVNARASSNNALARFYSERFRGEAKSAFEAWMATQPFDNPNAPAHPFLTDFYQPRLLAQAREAEAESDRLAVQAGDAGRTSRNYVLITVLFASVLFCGGTASRFEQARIRKGALLLGLAAFVFAVERLWLLPAQL